MAPRTRNNPQLQRRISHLRLHLHRLNTRLLPLYPQPHGPPHPKFPRTILHYLLLTEDELDAIAHHYSQSTPDRYTNDYPAPMGWDADFLARPDPAAGEGAGTPQPMPWDEAWLAQFGWVTRASRSPSPFVLVPSTHHHIQQQQEQQQQQQQQPHDSRHTVPELPALSPSSSSPSSSPALLLTPPPISTAERISIKRRKLGKFIGLRGCDTPLHESRRRVRLLEGKLLRAVARGSQGGGARGAPWSGGGYRGPRVGKDLF